MKLSGRSQLVVLRGSFHGISLTEFLHSFDRQSDLFLLLENSVVDGNLLLCQFLKDVSKLFVYEMVELTSVRHYCIARLLDRAELIYFGLIRELI